MTSPHDAPSTDPAHRPDEAYADPAAHDERDPSARDADASPDAELRSAERAEAIANWARWLTYGGVALVALAAFGAWQYSNIQRARVARVRSDHRALATAISSYYIDNMGYPLARAATSEVFNSLIATTLPTIPSAGHAQYLDMHGRALPGRTQTRVTFATSGKPPGTPHGFHMLTSPITYVAGYFNDPFILGRRENYTYLPDGPGFLLVGYGPRSLVPGASDESLQGFLKTLMKSPPTAWGTTPFDGRAVFTSRVNISVAVNPMTGVAFTFDPTNGLFSAGDIWDTSR